MSGVAVIDATAPAERIAAFRVLTGMFAVGYIAARLPVFVRLRSRDPAGFEPVGVLTPLDQPLPGGVVLGLIALTLGAGIAYTVGWRFAAT